MAFQFNRKFSHAGISLNPKLVYLLPPAMESFMVANGLGAVTEEEVDEDMSHLPWDTATTLLPPNGGVLMPHST